MSDSVRPSSDISTGLPGGPTACEASDAFVIVTGTWSTPPEALTCADAGGGVARAERVDAVELVLRAAVPEVAEVEDRVDDRRRVAAGGAAHGRAADLEHRVAAANVWSSAGSPAVTPLNADGKHALRAGRRSIVSERTRRRRVVRGRRACGTGSPSAVSWALAPLKVNAPPRGLTWLRERLSAPALKWHVAHAVRPSLPACMSQNSALPSLTALDLLLMYVASSGGVGHRRAVERREQRRAAGTGRARCPPAATHTARPAHASARAIAARSAIRRPVAAEAAPRSTPEDDPTHEPCTPMLDLGIPIRGSKSSMSGGYRRTGVRSTGSGQVCRGVTAGVQGPAARSARISPCPSTMRRSDLSRRSVHGTSTASSNHSSRVSATLPPQIRPGFRVVSRGWEYDQGVGGG